MTQYKESLWPDNDQYLNKQLQNSSKIQSIIIEIIGKNYDKKPLKHKAYDQWYWGDWSDGKPRGKGIFYNQTNNRKVFYEGDFDGLPNGRGRVMYNEG